MTNHDVKAIEYVLKERFKSNAELHKVREQMDLLCGLRFRASF